MRNTEEFIEEIISGICELLPPQDRDDFKQNEHLTRSKEQYSYWDRQLTSNCSSLLRKRIQQEITLLISTIPQAKANHTLMEKFAWNIGKVDQNNRVKLQLFILKQLIKIGNIATHEERKTEIEFLHRALDSVKTKMSSHIRTNDKRDRRTDVMESMIRSFRESIYRIQISSEIESMVETIPTKCKTIIHSQEQLFEIGLTTLTQALTLNRVESVPSSIYNNDLLKKEDQDYIRSKYSETKLTESGFGKIFLYLTGNEDDFINNLPINRFVLQFLIDKITSNNEDFNYSDQWIIELINRSCINEFNATQIENLFKNSMFYDHIDRNCGSDLLKGTCFNHLTNNEKKSVIQYILPTILHLVISLINLRASKIKCNYIKDEIIYLGEACIATAEHNKSQLNQYHETVTNIIESFVISMNEIKNALDKKYRVYFPNSSIFTDLASWVKDIITTSNSRGVTSEVEDSLIRITEVINTLEKSLDAVDSHIKDIIKQKYTNKIRLKSQDTCNINFIFHIYPPLASLTSNLSTEEIVEKIIGFLIRRNSIGNNFQFSFQQDENFLYNLTKRKTYSYDQISIALKVQGILGSPKEHNHITNNHLSFVKKGNFSDIFLAKIYEKIVNPYQEILKDKFVAFFHGYSYENRETLIVYHAQLHHVLEIVQDELNALRENNYLNYQLQLSLINSSCLAFLNSMVEALPNHKQCASLLSESIATGKQAIKYPLFNEDPDNSNTWQIVSIESELVGENSDLKEKLCEANNKAERAESETSILRQELIAANNRAEEESRRAELAEERAELAEDRAEEERRRAELAEERAELAEERAELAEDRAEEERRRAELFAQQVKQAHEMIEILQARLRVEANRTNQAETINQSAGLATFGVFSVYPSAANTEAPIAEEANIEVQSNLRNTR